MVMAFQPLKLLRRKINLYIVYLCKFKLIIFANLALEFWIYKVMKD